MTPRRFPPEKDLAPGDRCIAMTLDAESVVDRAERRRLVPKIIQHMVNTYREAGGGGDCDLIFLAVPKGKARPFAEGLQEALNPE